MQDWESEGNNYFYVVSVKLNDSLIVNLGGNATRLPSEWYHRPMTTATAQAFSNIALAV